MTDFYRAFEDKNRGSRKLVTERLKVYMPFIEPLTNIYKKAAALDLGCGRGEWLELLIGQKFAALGIDIDGQMLAACHELKLNVIQTDALTYLKQQTNDSYTVISAFHVVEHISINDVKQLVDEAFRVLKPGGLLIMETPNPENIVVATNNFYLDPTHIRPVPQQLLSFIAEFAGFARVKVLGLQEDKGLKQKKYATLADVLAGASPDYAIIAQKEAPAKITSQFDEPFSREYGISLQTLMTSWQQKQNEQIKITQKVASTTDDLHKRISVVEETLCKEASQTLELHAASLQQLQQMNNTLQQKFTEMEKLQTTNQHYWQLAEQRQQQINALTNSWSWRITLPLRFLADCLKAPTKSFSNAVKWPFIWLVKKLVRTVLDNPVKADKINNWLLQKLPFIHRHLRQFAIHRGLLSPVVGEDNTALVSPSNYSKKEAKYQRHASSNALQDVSHLTPRARQIFHDLTANIAGGKD